MIFSFESGEAISARWSVYLEVGEINLEVAISSMIVENSLDLHDFQKFSLALLLVKPQILDFCFPCFVATTAGKT